MLIIGTVIGAGFASGREIVAYFGQTPPPVIGLIVGIFVFLSTAILLAIGLKSKASEVTEVNAFVAGSKGGSVISIVILLNSVVSLSAMLAGTDSLFSFIAPSKHLFSLILGGLSVLVVTLGLKGLKTANLILVPLLIGVILSVTLSSRGEVCADKVNGYTLSASFVYTAMNMLLATGVLTTVSDLSKKQIFGVSALTGAIVGALLYAIASALSSTASGSTDMPLITLSKAVGKPMYAIAVVCVASGIFTTMLTAHQTLTDWLNGFLGSRLLSAVISLTACFMLSLIGFKSLVDNLYPLFGVAGALYLLLAVLKLMSPFLKSKSLPSQSGKVSLSKVLLSSSKATEKPFAKRDYKIHKPRQNAKNNG